MYQNEAAARRLVASLAALGIAARADGGGVHWHVDVAPVSGRSLRVHCFWYERDISALMLGMNATNGRSRLRATHAPLEGDEFYVTLDDGTTRIADGRTVNFDEVIVCVRVWLSGASHSDVIREAPFIDQRRRAMQAIAVRLDPRLRWDIGSDPAFELWAYGGRRSCCVTGESCSFHVGQAQVALLAYTHDVSSDIAAWLLEGASLDQLAARGAEIERHAELIEVDPARWHWLHVRDRIADPEDVLAPLAPLIRMLAESEIVSRYYTFSSLNRLCFSASSHYPWVGTYPVVSPGRDGGFYIGRQLCDLNDAVARVEAALAASPIEPFFGSEPDYEVRLVAQCLARYGSTLRPEIVRRGLWSDVWLVQEPRRCRVGLNHLSYNAGDRLRNVECSNIDEVVKLALRFLNGEGTCPGGG